MAVPYMASTMKGWTRNYTVELITQSVIDFETTEASTTITLKMNKQPMPPAEVNRKPEEQRTWKWWSLIVVEGQELETDDIVVVDGMRFRVELAHDWSESGFRKYEVIEDYN